MLADGQSCLLVRQRGLESRLLVHTGSLQSVGFLLNASLLLVVQVGESRLKTRLCAKLLRLHLRAQVLLTHRKTCLLVGLLGRQTSLLFHVKLLLSLLKPLLQPLATNV